MSASENYRWRKTTDVNREYAIFELLANEKVILDVGYSDTSVFEVAFNQDIGGFVLDWVRFQALIDEGKRLADLDR